MTSIRDWSADAGIEEDTQKNKYLTFALGNEMYGIEIRHVTEIIGIQKITEIPELPEHMRGIINLRGKIIPVMDVRLRFRKPLREYTDRTCIIVVDIGELSLGLIVDSVSEVLSIAERDIVPPPETGRLSSRFISGIGKAGGGTKLLLDALRLIGDEELEYFQP